jgi:hypothetical protein
MNDTERPGSHRGTVESEKPHAVGTPLQLLLQLAPS